MLLLISQQFLGTLFQNAFSFGYSICYIDTTWVFPWSFKFSWFWFSHSGSCFSSESNNACCLLIPAICNNNDCAAAFRYYAIMGSLGLRLYKSIFKRVYEKINSNWLDNWSNCLYDHVLIVWQLLTDCDNRNEMEE